MTQSATAARLAESLGIPVSRDQVRRWAKKGYDLTNPAQLAHDLKMTERPPGGLIAPSTTVTPALPREPMSPQELDARLARLEGELLNAADYNEARTIRVQISGCRELFRIQVERGNYALKSEVEKFVMHIATQSRQKWESLENDLPPILDGLDTAPKIAKELRAFSRRACIELADVFGKPQ